MAGKRKRADTLGMGEVEGEQVNGDGQVKQLETFQEWLADIMELLKDQDSTPSTLDRPISTSIQESHDAKRTKLSEPSDQTTIATLIKSNAYTSIEEVIKDVDRATSSIAEELQEKISSDRSLSSHQIAHPELSRVRAVKNKLDKLVSREIMRRPEIVRFAKDVKSEISDEQDAKATFDDSGNNVLTLLGNMGSGRTGQLFTSLRKPTTSDEPLNEAALPNGITATKIIPVHSIDHTEDKKHVPTIGERFPPPAGLLPLPLPKQSRHTATRSSSVNWYNPAEGEAKSKSSKRDGYTSQPLPTGQWLTYNAVPSSTQIVSPESKRKQRDRALSFGEPQTSVSQEAMLAHDQAKEDALFRRVYSSFAPDRDDSGAIVAEQQKNRFWWSKYGEQRYHEILGTRDSELYKAEANDIVNDDGIDDGEIQEAIRTWEPEETPREMNPSKIVSLETPETSKEADDVLTEISDLLETLDSHQRVRNLTLTANAHTIGGQNPQSTALTGTPTSPSSAEFDVYEVLKAQLTLIVSTLPPYLVAKLDGERLGALNISTNIQLESKNQKGTMESEDSAAGARASVRPTATSGIPQAASAYTTGPSRSGSYTATPVQRYQHQPGYGAQTAHRQSSNSGYLQNPQYSNRPASYNYSAGARPTYPPQGQQAPQRAATSSNYAPQYGQQSSQSFGSYQHGYRGYPGVGPNGSNYNYNQQYSTPQARPPNSVQQPQAYRGSQTDYQQRVVPPQGYGYGSAPVAGNAPSHQQRPPFSTPSQTTAPPQRPATLYHTHSSQYSAQSPASPQINGTRSSGSPTVLERSMNASEQFAMMAAEKKAQLAERQGSGTPQPPAGQYGQQNGTPVPQQNGVAA